MLWSLGRGREVRARRCCEQLRLSQKEEGGWSIYPGGPVDPNPSVKSYFALKLDGDDEDALHMRKARKAILEAGGIEACNSFTKLLLCVFGQFEWKLAPAVPPELIRMPLWAPINIWEMSSWSRAIVVPLSIVWACKPKVETPDGCGIQELRTYAPAPEPIHLRNVGVTGKGWVAAFRALDKLLKLAEAARLFVPLRRGSIERCKRWIEERLAKSDGLGAIFPSILNVILAYKALGYPDHHPVVASQLRELEKLEVSNGDALAIQPCRSPVWDTSLTMNALLETGLEVDHPSLETAKRWLLGKEAKEPGDWQRKNPDGPVGGWYFEYNNEFYPDCDDTAEILVVLGKMNQRPTESEQAGGDDQQASEALERGLAWQLSMQNEDGGWAAFDRNCDKKLLTYVPFADHNAMIDPSTADVTSRTVEALRLLGIAADSPALNRALAFLRCEQEEDGSWYGRWGCNYIYGTWLALCALASVGESAFDGSSNSSKEQPSSSRRGVDWLLSVQNHDGGWGETLGSYDDPSLKGCGETTAAQTAWALMGLMAGVSWQDDRLVSQAVERGIGCLLERQHDDGGWVDEPWTGTGFPSVFYLRYYGYALYFPAQALATYRRQTPTCDATGREPIS